MNIGIRIKSSEHRIVRRRNIDDVQAFIERICADRVCESGRFVNGDVVRVIKTIVNEIGRNNLW